MTLLKQVVAWIILFPFVILFAAVTGIMVISLLIIVLPLAAANYLLES